MAAVDTPTPAAAPWPWKRGLLWLLFLAPFFFASYGFANWWTAQYASPGEVVFSWERSIPFLPWTIVPYWSIDLFYGLSFLLCRDRQDTDRHGLCLLSAQLISIGGFLLFPLRFTFERPATDGIFGWMFDVLMGFDQPFNQAPSLHIGLLVILWARFASAARGGVRLAVHAWSLLIGISVLTTYQHHFIDLPTGAAVGAFCLWLWPRQGRSPLAALRLSGCSTRRRLARRYAGGSLLMLAPAFAGGGWLWFCWPALALAMVAFAYAFAGTLTFQKTNGTLSVGAAVLLAPYLLGAWLNSRWWTRQHPQPTPICQGLWLGRLPSQRDLASGRFAAVLDLTAELPFPRHTLAYRNLPWLDLVVPDAQQLAAAADEIDRLRAQQPVLVCCALGYSRSAIAVAAWLLAAGLARDVDHAVQTIAEVRPRLVLGGEHRRALAEFLARLESDPVHG